MKFKVGTSAPLTRSDKLLGELAIHIAHRSKGDPAFGATKLNKLLFYSDFSAYLNFGKAITGTEYFKLPQGPAPRRWKPVCDALVGAKEIKMDSPEFHGRKQKRIVPLRKASLEAFSTEEIRLVDNVIDRCRGKNASEISDESHGFLGWKLASEQETIPYEVARVSDERLDEAELSAVLPRAMEALKHVDVR